MNKFSRTVLPWIGLLLAAVVAPLLAQEPTYAERLGYPKGARVAILHVDDAGMSHDSNLGAIRAVTEGVANSMSVMMPCSWVPELVDFLHQHPEVDAGLHLTLTSEWEHYRWGPLVGRSQAPGLVDAQGCLWRTVEAVVQHATADEVEAEIRAQLARARAMGFEPTHLDSHMGTVLATPEFIERYLEVGIENGIPLMVPGGHNTALEKQYRDDEIRRLERLGEWHGQDLPTPPQLLRAPELGSIAWAGGLPVLDDLHNTSYGWTLPQGVEPTDDRLRELKVERYSQALRELSPGVTMIIMHATDPQPGFAAISGSGPTRKGDLLAMVDPRLRKVIEEEGIILATWRELMQRRKRVGG